MAERDGETGLPIGASLCQNPAHFMTMPALPSFWDLSYRDRDNVEHWDPPTVPPELVEAVRDGLVRAGEMALDIGCGAGCESVYLAGEGVHVIGVDSSPVGLEIARGRAAEAGVVVDWQRGDAAQLPVADDSIDFALDRGCFHVISRRRRPQYAEEVARVLRPGGRFLLRGAWEDDEEAGLIGFDQEEIERLFGSLGFECGEVGPVRLESRAGGWDGSKVILRWKG